MIRRAVRYAGPSALARTLCGDLLGAREYSLLLNAADVGELLAALRTTSYAAAVNETGRRFDYAIRDRWRENVEKIAARAPGVARELCLAYLARLELEAVKTLLRGIVAGVERRRLLAMLPPLPSASSIPLGAIGAAADFEQAAAALKDTPYHEAIVAGIEASAAQSSARATRLFPASETALDRQYFARLITAAGRFSGGERVMIERMVGMMADAENLLAVERLKKIFQLSPADAALFLIPFGARLDASRRRALLAWNGERPAPYGRDTGASPAALRVVLMRALNAEARRLLFTIPFHAGLLFAFAIMSDHEAADLIAIHEARRWGLARNDVFDRLIRAPAHEAIGEPGV